MREAQETAPPRSPRWAAGIVNHGSFDDLGGCLSSLAKQTHPPETVIVWDTGVAPEKLDQVASRYPTAEFLRGDNVGYAGGANRVVSAAKGRADFTLVLNPDVELDSSFAETLLKSIASDSGVAIASGKLLRPGREIIDTAGINIPRHRRPRDRGSEDPDCGQFDLRELVDAVSGAAFLIRMNLVDALSLEGELFDEAFFAYHEDTDLCWRARRLDYQVVYEPNAVAVHARGWQKEARFRVPAEIRRHSFKNHYLQLVKNETLRGFIVNAPWLISWEVLRLGFVLLRDRKMLGAYREAVGHLPSMLRRRRILRTRKQA